MQNSLIDREGEDGSPDADMKTGSPRQGTSYDGVAMLGAKSQLLGGWCNLDEEEA